MTDNVDSSIVNLVKTGDWRGHKSYERIYYWCLLKEHVVTPLSEFLCNAYRIAHFSVLVKKSHGVEL